MVVISTFFSGEFFMVLPLSQIDLGEHVKVVWVASEKSMAERLEDLGFIPDEEISVS